MWTATIRGIAARRVRLALTALAVLLGVAFVAGTFVLTDTLRRSFDLVFDDTLSGVDLVVRARSGGDVGVIAGGVLGGTQRDRVPDATVATVRAVDGVAAANGVVYGYAQFVGGDGDAIQTGALPTLGLAWPASGSAPLRLVGERGRPPRGPGEVAMDAATAREHGFAVGDRVEVLSLEEAREFEIVALFGFGDTVELGGITFAAFDLNTAQGVLGAPGAVDAVNVTAESGVSMPGLRARVEAAVGSGVEVEDAAAVAEDTGVTVGRFVGLFTAALLAFATVALVVGGFIIFNTFAILVAQRTRELGLLRAMGASGTQVGLSVVGEAALVGTVASALGIAVGSVAAAFLLEAVEGLGFDVPDGGTVVLGRTVAVAAAVGLVVTVGSAVVPAVRAARIPPVEAIHDAARSSAAPLRRRAFAGLGVLLLGLVVLTAGLVGDPVDDVERVVVVGAGALGAFLGAVILVATVARPLARVLGWPVARALGVTGVIARGNAIRNPRRTAATASALIVGLGLVCLVAIFADSTKASLREAVEGGMRADLVLTTESLTGFSPRVAEQIRDLPAVEAASGLRLGAIVVERRPEFIAAVDASVLDDVLDLDVGAGGAGGLATGGVLVHEDEADDYGVGPGDTITVGFPRVGSVPLPVVGVYGQRNFIGGFPAPSFVVSRDTFESSFGGTQQDSLVYVKARDGREAAARHQVERALRDDFPNIEVRTRDEFRKAQEETVDRFVAGLVALLLLSELIAVLGIVNTLFLSVYERTRELGLLRAVGMSPRQVRAVIRGESVIVAVLGGLVGIVVGVFWGWAFTHALARQGITEFTVPAGQLVVFLALSVVAGVVAALLPAWRAGRLDVLEAIAQE